MVDINYIYKQGLFKENQSENTFLSTYLEQSIKEYLKIIL